MRPCKRSCQPCCTEVLHNLSLIHLIVALSAAACIYLVVRELRRQYVSEWRLFAPGIAALIVAAPLFLGQIVAGEPRWIFAVAAAIGLAIGGVRAMMIGLQHDLYRPQIVVSQSAKLSFIGVAVIVGICAVLEIIGAYLSPSAETLRLWAALSVVVCAVAMLARALVLTFRLRREHY
jgi:hypothetical protein